MPARRAHLRRGAGKMTPALRPLAERLLELEEAHIHAVRTGEDAFYRDGRHQELVELLPTVHKALGIKPWDNDYAMLRDALGSEADV